MSYLSKNRFKELSEIQAPYCISIYLPTIRVGDQGKNRLRFKNQLKAVKNELTALSLQEKEVKNIIEPARSLLDGIDFWNDLKDGLAVFIHDGKLDTLTSDHSFQPKVYVNDHLHLLQLSEEVGNRIEFHLLVLSGNSVKLYEGDNDQLQQIEIENRVPTSLEEAVGSDYEQKALQYRSGQGEAEGGMYHGQGSGSDAETKKEFRKFFHALDDWLNKQLPVIKKKPLIVAGDEHTFHLFREVTTYPLLFEEPLRGNHEKTADNALLEQSLALISANADKGLEEAKANFQELLIRGKSSSQLSQVIGAAYYGQVAELFVNESVELQGYFSPDTNEVTIHDSPEVSSVDLLNFAAIQTINQDGKAYLLNKDEMPDKTAPLNANFRYEVVNG